MADFEPAYKFTMESEDPNLSGVVTTDAGGRTRFGIAQKFHPDLPEEFFTGPKEEALAMSEKIEEQEYWNPAHLAEVNDQAIASKIFDMAINMGIHQAVIYAQRGCNALGLGVLAEDGKVGAKTMAAINSADPNAYMAMLCQLCEAHYRHVVSVNPAQAVNLKGWLKRAAKVPPEAA